MTLASLPTDQAGRCAGAPVKRPLLYDVFSGAGGAAYGYHLAGFEVVGIDNRPQPRYPFRFVQMDAFAFFEAVMRGDYQMPDAWHASPPCQGYSTLRNLPWLKGKDYPLMILPVRQFLESTGRHWVIENVYSARHGSRQLAKLGHPEHGMKAGWLCGTMFGRPFYRHRLFESSFFWMQPGHPKHEHTIRALGGRARDFVYFFPPRPRGTWEDKSSGIALVKQAMEIDWMTRNEITQAVPPAFTRYIGREMMRQCFGQEAR